MYVEGKHNPCRRRSRRRRRQICRVQHRRRGIQRCSVTFKMPVPCFDRNCVFFGSWKNFYIL